MKKLLSVMVMIVGLSTMCVSQAGLAHGGWHHHNHWHHHGGWHHHRHWHHHGGGWGPAIVFGTAVGLIAGAAIASDNTYHRSCYHQVTRRRVCRFDRFGYRHCYIVRRVANVC